MVQSLPNGRMSADLASLKRGFYLFLLRGFDERYSAREANEELKKMGYSWQKAKDIKDAMAAAMILKSF